MNPIPSGQHPEDFFYVIGTLDSQRDTFFALFASRDTGEKEKNNMDKNLTGPEASLEKQLNLLRFIMIPLFVLGALYAISAIVLFLILPAFGYCIGSTTNTGSMQPLMMGETLLVMETNVDFDELEVGDIISYRERVDANWASSSFVVRNYPVGSKPPKEEPEPELKYKDEGIQYKPDESIVHRIVEIIDGQGDRAIICKGDNNPVDDPGVVMESAFIGRVIWSKSYIGAAFRWIYKDHGVLWIGAAVFIPIVVWFLLLVLSYHKSHSKPSTPPKK